MNKKNLRVIIISFLPILFITNSILNVKADYTLVDETQDIIHMNTGATQASSLDVAPEIDIESLVINETTMAVSFVATPFLHIDNFYDVVIYWNGDEYDNYTDGHWNEGQISSKTSLFNSTGHEIVNITVSDSIELVGNTIYFPILNASLITNIGSPSTGIVDCRQRISVDGFEFYRDVLDFGTRSVPGYTILLSLFGITTVMMISIIRKKKK
ncbi:MAG: hypothetical protein FK733_04715 [Asgard group archaeon]|nr:hypothetical protein [Asgard group archaeon]